MNDKTFPSLNDHSCFPDALVMIGLFVGDYSFYLFHIFRKQQPVAAAPAIEI